MFSFTQISILSVLLFTVSVFGITVNTPATLIVCQPVALGWSGSSASPYYVAIKKGGDASGAALEQLGPFTTLTTTWTVNQPAGTSITIAVTDGNGQVNYSSAVTVQAGTSTACLTSTGSTTTTGAAASGAASASSSGTAAGVSAAASAAASASRTSGALPSINAKSLLTLSGLFIVTVAMVAL